MKHEHDFLPVTPQEVRARGWDAPDFVYVTGDAYVDHPSFGLAIISRVLERAGYRVAMLPQPDWHTCEDFRRFGRPKLGFLVTAGVIDSMVNHYTAAKKPRSEDAYSPGGKAGRPARPRHDRLLQPHPRGVRGRAHRHRRHRGVAAPLRALRLLGRPRAQFDPRRQRCRRADVRHGRALDPARGAVAARGQAVWRNAHPRHLHHGKRDPGRLRGGRARRDRRARPRRLCARLRRAVCRTGPRARQTDCAETSEALPAAKRPRPAAFAGGAGRRLRAALCAQLASDVREGGRRSRDRRGALFHRRRARLLRRVQLLRADVPSGTHRHRAQQGIHPHRGQAADRAAGL